MVTLFLCVVAVSCSTKVIKSKQITTGQMQLAKYVALYLVAQK